MLDHNIKISICCLAFFVACTETPAAHGLVIVYPPTNTTWLDVPWPSDLRRDAQGHPNLISYPDPQAAELLRDAIALAEASRGFALQPTIYAELGTAISAEQLEADPEVALQPDAPVQLLALDGPNERRPLALGQGGADDWVSPTAVHARPLMGWPLRPATRYALVITTQLRAADGLPFLAPTLIAEGLTNQGDLAEHLAPLRARLDTYDLKAADIVLATVFTTADPGAQMRSLVAAQKEYVSPLLIEPWHAPDEPTPRVYESRYHGLLWQHGQKPYSSEGGGFVFTGDEPTLASDSEPIDIAIITPAGSPPDEGWPVVIYQHGTGGSYHSFLSGSGSYAQNLTGEGIAMVGIDQPLHGHRGVPGTNESWHTFNPFNLEASAANLRQGALDALLLHRMIVDGRLNQDEPAIRLDRQRIFFFGHSQGGLTGALALPHWSSLPCAVLSGAGAGLTYTLLQRKDPLDVAEALKGWGGAETDLFASHPMLSLIQHAFEPSDPISSAPVWQRTAAHHLLMTSGRLDQQTPAITGDAMAMAALVPQLEPVVKDLWRHELEGLPPQTGRLHNNANYGDHQVTAAYRQSRQGDHFVLFSSTPIRRMTTRFLASCAATDAVISGR